MTPEDFSNQFFWTDRKWAEDTWLVFSWVSFINTRNEITYRRTKPHSQNDGEKKKRKEKQRGIRKVQLTIWSFTSRIVYRYLLRRILYAV